VTLREALLEATHRLELQRISNPRLCAEVLLSHFLNVDRSYLYAHDDRILTDAEYDALENGVYDRINGVPVQYIVGHQEFYGRDFIVNRSVLIPRPETEYIVDSVLELKPESAAKIIDVGTGSGCIGVTLAFELPNANVFAADISEAALTVAKQNAAALGALVRFVCMDLLDAISGTFDFVVSNPPYVRRGDFDRLQREVREHEPQVALFSPEGETEIYRRLIRDAARVLRPGGYLICEIGYAMEDAVLELLRDDWERLPTKRDLQGIPRTVIARRRLETETTRA
jgi:release factor glutamine methyltransferase